MRYLHLIYALVSVIVFFPFFLIGWCANEALASYRVGFRECANYNRGPLLAEINKIAHGE